MMNLAEYRTQRRRPRRLPALGGAGRRRASSSTRTAASSAPRASAAPISTAPSPAELVAVAGRLNNALRRLGSGWAIFVEAQRIAAPRPIRESLFPDPASALVDAERKADFEEAGAHFESRATS